MAISKVQPMREAEIELVDEFNQLSNNFDDEVALRTEQISTLASSLSLTQREFGNFVVDATNAITGEQTARTNADTALASRITNEVSARENADTALSERIDALPIFEYGAKESNTVAASGSVSITVTFADEKESTPYVLVTVQCTSDTSHSENMWATVSDVSTTGFTVHIYNGDSAYHGAFDLIWLAIGE